MADFTGMTVQVTMRTPPDLVLRGRVKHVVAGQTLTLQDVYFPHSGTSAPSYLVRGPEILDLQVVDASAPFPPPAPAPPLQQQYPPPAAPPQHPSAPPRQQPSANAAPLPIGSVVPVRTAPIQPQRQPSDFVDPAILSYGKSPVQTKTASKAAEPPTTPIKSMLAKAAESLPSNSSPFIGDAGKSSSSRKVSQPAPQRQTPTKVESSGQKEAEVDGTQETGQQADTTTKKKARRTQKKKAAVSESQDPPPVMNVEVSRNGNDMSGSVRRGKGWRQTPLLQPSPQHDSPKGKSSSRKSRKDHEELKEAQQNGWATEDATDIQDLGDFDFEANHKLFDKKQVFDQLRQGDTTADEDRLVGHNKVARPGTYGGKNLHPTENVLSPPLGAHELDSTSDADTELNFANGRSSSRTSNTRVALKKQPSRQGSAQVDMKPHPLSASMSSDRPLNRSVNSLKTVPSIATSPRVDRAQSPHSAISTTRAHATPVLASHPAEPYLAISSTMNVCPTLHPSALETLEKETVSRYSLTHDAITETAARSVAETAMGMFSASSTDGSRRGSRANTLRGSISTHLPTDRASLPVIVILAGNHALGARAAAAARHLVSRKTAIIIAESQYESIETQDVQMKTQLAILNRMAKSGANIKRGPWRKAWGSIKNLPGPPAIIIDALLGGETYESLLNTSSNAQHAAAAQKEAREMIDWANRSRAPVLSVGCPSGVSGLDGTSTTLEGEPLAVRPDRVLCLAAPMRGVLDAMAAGERWDARVADIGVNIALVSDEAVAFGAKWVVGLRFVGGEEEMVEEAA